MQFGSSEICLCDFHHFCVWFQLALHQTGFQGYIHWYFSDMPSVVATSSLTTWILKETVLKHVDLGATLWGNSPES